MPLKRNEIHITIRSNTNGEEKTTDLYTEHLGELYHTAIASAAGEAAGLNIAQHSFVGMQDHVVKDKR